MRVYADAAATSRLCLEAAREMQSVYKAESFGNPSSAHRYGYAAQEELEAARKKIAKCINAEPEEIFFTSGGTESNNWAAAIAADRQIGDFGLAFISPIEHPSVSESARFRLSDLHALPVNEDGVVDARDVEMSIELNDRVSYVSVMYANNEIGTIQPIAEIGAVCRRNGVLFHTDAVQAVGHIPVDVKALQVDMLSASAHKFNGPKGVGFLYVRQGVPMLSLLDGGGQERGMRSGTENVPGIVGMAVALELLTYNLASDMRRVSSMRDRLIGGLLQVPGSRINGCLDRRVPGNISITFDGVPADSLVFMLDKEGVAVSTGSACSTGDLAPSHVLTALDRTAAEARSTIRISLDRTNNDAEIDYMLGVIPKCVSALRDLGAA